jgi:hypothetical protein
MCEEPEPYDGPFVVIEPDQRGQYRVSIDPLNGLDLSRTFDAKDPAWSYARDLWCIFKLPLRDLTDHNVSREPPSSNRKNTAEKILRSGAKPQNNEARKGANR